MTAKEGRDKNPNLNGNIRDYATMNELICLANSLSRRRSVVQAPKTISLLSGSI